MRAAAQMILSRLRLRHGRHSCSAAHLAHQQTLLEILVEQKHWLKCSAAAPASPLPTRHSNGSSAHAQTAVTHASSVASAADADEPPEGEEHCQSEEERDMQRLRQLIRVVEETTAA
jgi:hypothetical protein